LPDFSFLKSKNTFFLFLLFTVASLLLDSGCASTHAKVPPSQRQQAVKAAAVRAAAAAQEATDTAAYADSAESGDSLSADEIDSIYDDPADLIEVAKSYIADSNYASADSTLKEAVRAVENMDQATEGAHRLPPARYLEQIAAVYKEQMPASYPMPEDITMAVFQNQMMLSMDSMNVLPSDSVAMAAIACQKNLSYDVPMVWNQRVQRALYFYLKNRSITVDRWFFRASYYLPVMKTMFADSGLPQDLAYLPLIESGFNPLAYSYANALGIWQFIASTGKLYGLRRDFWIDERRDPIRSTEAAIGYLKKLYSEFGNWHLALAAYNCGENGVTRCIARHGTNDYWALKRLPRQTKNYVPCYLAALTIAKNPKCFGVFMPTTGTLPLDTVRLDGCVSMADIAAGLGVDCDSLKKMNPHIMRWCTPPDVANAILYLPSGKKKSWSTFYAKLPPEKRVRWLRYEIKRNDTIQNVAGQHNVTADALAAINRLTLASKLVPGHHLFIPASDTTLGVDVAYSLPPESEIKALDLPDYEFSGVVVRHRIRPGDNLGKIARHYHVRITQLCRWNRITARTLLRPGRVLVVSRPIPVELASSSAPAAAGKTAPVAASAAGPVAAAASAQAGQPVAQVQLAVQSAEAPAAASQAVPDRVHVVKIGETPFSISRQYNITLLQLTSLNHLNMAHPRIKIGQMLVISMKTPAQVAAVVAPSPAPATQDTVSQKNAMAKNIKVLDMDSVDSGSSSKTVMQKPTTAPAAADQRRHVVAKGENLFRISQKYSLTVAALMAANAIGADSLVRAGDTLLIPAGNETPSQAAKPAAQSETPSAQQAKAAAQPDVIYYKVKEGDTLLRIAAAFGVPVNNLCRENNMDEDSAVAPGKLIRVVAK